MGTARGYRYADARLRLAPRRSEHVDCAAGQHVLAAGEVPFVRDGHFACAVCDSTLPAHWNISTA